MMLGTGAYYAWKKWGLPLTQQAPYRLSVDSVEVTGQPSWIRCDVKAEAVRDASLGNSSIFDKDLTLRVCRAFEMHPWVARVNRVSKRSPGRLIVELEYRRPVAWVEVPPGVLPSNEVGLLPIDEGGVLLPPQDFSEARPDDYIRIAVAELTTCGLPGSPWGDPRVAAAARIAAMLADHSQRLGLHKILAYYDSANGGTGRRTTYEVTSRRGLRFIWGSAPGQETSGEPAARQKGRRLIQIAEAAAAGSQVPGHGAEIDLRDPNVVPPTPRAAQRQDRLAY
jgi:hypothetical protein